MGVHWSENAWGVGGGSKDDGESGRGNRDRDCGSGDDDEIGGGEMGLYVNANNGGAISLYRRGGFEIRGRAAAASGVGGGTIRSP